MAKNLCKISVLVWLALLLFVFSCENEAEKERIRVEREIQQAREDSIQITKEDSIRGYRLVGANAPRNKRERDSLHAQIAKEDSIRGWRLLGDIPINKTERDSFYRHFDSTQAVRDSFWKDKVFDLPSSPDFETVFNFCSVNFPDASDCYKETRMRILEKKGIQVKRKRARIE